MSEQTTNEIRIGNFLLERAKDFDVKTGDMINGRGWFASKISGRHVLKGVWFPTYDAAMAAIHAEQTR